MKKERKKERKAGRNEEREKSGLGPRGTTSGAFFTWRLAHFLISPGGKRRLPSLPPMANHASLLLELPADLLSSVARALLCDDPQQDSRAAGRLATSSKTLQRLVSTDANIVAGLVAARKMLTHLLRYQILVARDGATKCGPFPFARSNYLREQLPDAASIFNHAFLRSPDAMGKMLRVSDSLNQLRISRSEIGDEGARLFADGLGVNRSLTSLDITWNHIGEEGARALANGVASNRTLIDLDLSHNNLRDGGASALVVGMMSNQTLLKLRLGNAKIGDGGARAIADWVSRHPRLRFLDLRQNKICDEGAKSLATGMQSSGALAEVYLQENKIGDEGATALAEALAQAPGKASNPHWTVLDLRYNNMIGDNVVQAFVNVVRTVSGRNLRLHLATAPVWSSKAKSVLVGQANIHGHFVCC